MAHIGSTLNTQLKHIYNWMCSNKLSLNFDKTESLLIGSRTMLNKCTPLNLRIQGRCIQPQENVKYLGVVIDQQLKWDKHIDYSSAKVSKLINFLGRLRHYFTESSLKLIYQSIILPIFDYADVVYDSSTKGCNTQLQKLQNRAGRIILGISPFKHISNRNIHQILNWESLACRRQKHINSMVFKIIHDLSAPYLKDSFDIINHNYSLRSIGNLSLPKPRTESCRRMFSYRGASQFNVLPSTLKSSPNYNIFITALNDQVLKTISL